MTYHYNGETSRSGIKSEAVRFAIVGTLTATMYFVNTILMINIFGLHPVISVSTSYIISIIFNYLAHYYWTYRSSVQQTKAFARYIVLGVTIMTMNATITYIFNDILEINYIIGQVVFVIMTLAVTFLVQRHWIYRSS